MNSNQALNRFNQQLAEIPLTEAQRRNIQEATGVLISVMGAEKESAVKGYQTIISDGQKENERLLSCLKEEKADKKEADQNG